MLCVLAAATLWLTGRGTRIAFAQLILQAAVYGAFFLALGRLPSLRQMYGALPSATRAALILCLYCCVLAQCLQTLQVSYPFVGWNMYARAEPVSRAYVYEYAGVTGTGATVAIEPSAMFPALQSGFLEWRLHKLLDKSLESEKADRLLRVLAPGFSEVNLYRRRIGAGPRELVRAISLRDP